VSPEVKKKIEEADLAGQTDALAQGKTFVLSCSSKFFMI